MRYRPEIDGLRALAVVPVVLYHAGASSPRGGFLGVDVFFVISGYLITTLLRAEMNSGSFSLSHFYERRARRILPALFLILATISVLGWLWLMPADLRDFSQSLAAVAAFGSNLLFWRQVSYFDTAAAMKPLLHTWSLALEEQFYLLFPIFLLLVRRWWRGRERIALALVALSSFALAQWGARHTPAATFYLLPMRGWEILLGALTAEYMSNQDKAAQPARGTQLTSLLGLAVLAASLLLIPPAAPQMSWLMLLPTGATALLLATAQPGTMAHRLLSLPVLVHIGLLSYSAYLWHHPLFVLAKYRLSTPPSPGLMLALAALSFGLAYLTWRLVETPFRRREFLSRRAIFCGAAAGAAVLLAAGLAGYYQDGFPGRLPERAVRLAAGADDVNPRRVPCMSSAEHYLSPANSCVLGNPANVVGIVWGDSHADALAEALSQQLWIHHVGLRLMWHGACPPFPGIELVTGPTVGECGRHRAEVLQELASHPEYRNVVLAARLAYYLESSTFDNGEGGAELLEPRVFDDAAHRHTVRPAAERRRAIGERYIAGTRQLLAMGRRVILVYPIPEAGWNIPTYAAQRALVTDSDEPITTSYQAYQQRQAATIAALDAVGAAGSLARVYPSQALCNTYAQGRCLATLHGRSLYMDDDHLSTYGAQLVAPLIAREIR